MSADGMTFEGSALLVGDRDRATLKDYISLLKVGITVANVMAALAGVLVGSHGHPPIMQSIFALLGTALVVASGAALNNYVDRDIDLLMKRTERRVVSTGRVRPQAALTLGITLGVVGILMLTFLVNVVAAASAFVGLITYAYLYTVWFKRTTSLSTVIGGISGAMPPLIGFAAGSGGTIGIAGWVVFSIFFLWQPPHFLPLAMKRCEEYRAAGIPMLPVVAGNRQSKWQILSYTAALVPVSLLLYALGYENVIYLVIAAGLGVFFMYRAIQGIFAKDDLAWAKKTFTFSLIYLTTMCVALMVGAA